jgi:general secretion pathway protein J
MRPQRSFIDITRASGRRASCGLTLIELMVALAIFSVLGILSYRAIDSASITRDRLANKSDRWQEVSRFFQLTESQLLQIVGRPTVPGAPSSSLVITPSSGGTDFQFSFLKLDGARNSVRRVGYRFAEDRILMLRWPGVDGDVTPTEHVVLENVKDLRLKLITDDGRTSATWPAQPPAKTALPDGIEIQLEINDVGTLRRLFALR